MAKRLKNFISENTGILIRLDDISENMNWEMFDRTELLFDKYGIKPVLGVIPNNKDSELLNYPKREDFWEKVKAWKKKGWEIAMHGYDHLYNQETNKEDYFGYGGKSEFFGNSLEKQKEKIKNGLKIFSEKEIPIRVFFAPNHTYDKNTFAALKNSGIFEIIDGYGIMPYVENQIKFIPQLFYKFYILPIGIQSTQIHLNYWKQNDFEDFEKFINKNLNKIITYEEALKKVNTSLFFKLIKKLTEVALKTKRILNK